MADVKSELRAFWESQRGRLRKQLDDAQNQRATEAVAFDSENNSLHEVARRVALAEQKFLAAKARCEEIMNEIEHVEQTIEFLRGE